MDEGEISFPCLILHLLSIAYTIKYSTEILHMKPRKFCQIYYLISNKALADSLAYEYCKLWPTHVSLRDLFMNVL